MTELPNPSYEILPPPRRSLGAPAFRTAREDEDWIFDRFADRFADKKSSPCNEGSQRLLARFLAIFVLAVAAITAWHSYGHAARAKLASLSPRLAWLAPVEDASDRVEQISRHVDRIAASIAASQEQLTRTIDHLATDQEQMTREIIRLQELSFDKSPEPRQADAGGRRTARRSSQAR